MNPIQTREETITLVVISAGISEESATHRLADGLTKAVRARLDALGPGSGELMDDDSASPRPRVDVVRIDLRELAHDLASASLTGFAAGALAAAYEQVAKADAVIAVSPTYKASYTGLFKSFWDIAGDGVMAGVPVILGATGGTPRHSLMPDTAMRPMFAFMKALTLPTAVYAAAQDWGNPALVARMDEAAGELAAQLTKNGASSNVGLSPSEHSSANSPRTLAGTRERARDPFSAVATMEQLLRR